MQAVRSDGEQEMRDAVYKDKRDADTSSWYRRSNGGNMWSSRRSGIHGSNTKGSGLRIECIVYRLATTDAICWRALV